ncbi:49_t:CDS:2, partial [Funneliformis geosporum]
MSIDNNPINVEIAKIESFIISSNIKYVVTSHEDNSLAIWNSDFNLQVFEIFKIVKDETVLKHRFKKLLGLSNDKLLIYSCDKKLYIWDSETSKFIQHPDVEKPLLRGEKHLLFLLNENLLLLSMPYIDSSQKVRLRQIRDLLNKDRLLKWLLWQQTLFSLQYSLSMNVYSRASLKNLEQSLSSYKIPNIFHDYEIKMIDISRTDKKNEQIFFLCKDGGVIIEFNIEHMKIQNYYFIPNYKSTQFYVEQNGAVNEEGSLLAIIFNSFEEVNIYVFSMVNGLLISSRTEHNYKEFGLRIQFINYALMLYNVSNGEFKYMIMTRCKLSYAFKGETSQIRGGQLQIMIATGNHIKLIEFQIPMKMLYDQMIHDHYLIIYLSFNEIKDIISDLGQKIDYYRCEGKNLIWEYIDTSLCVSHKMDHMFDYLPFFGIIKNLHILSNDDVVLYGDDISIFGFNETTNRIVLRYKYFNTKEFYSRKSFPKPSLDIVDIFFKYNENMFNELLCSKKYLVELSDEIISLFLNQISQMSYELEHEPHQIIITCLDKIYEELVENNMMNYCLSGLITKHLPELYLHLPTYYKKFISSTSLIPYNDEPILSNKFKLKGYTNANSLQAYTCRESDFIQRISQISYFMSKENQALKRVIQFVVPYVGFTKYPPDYNYWLELLRPQDNPFVTLDDQTFYDGWNADAIINFKWNTFGRFYYYLLCVILGLFHIFYEVRQMIWNLYKYFTDLWNWFDLAAYIIPVYTAFVWLMYAKPPSPLVSISNLVLHLKFLTFLRALDYFGSNFTIIVGVAKRILSFLWILFFIIIGFAHAFYIILTPEQSYDLDEPFQNSDSNNPWNLVSKYQSVSPTGGINSESAIIQQPDSKLNQFSTYPTSLLAMYLFLTGDSSAFSAWTYQENPFMTTLLVMFSFLIV